MAQRAGRAPQRRVDIVVSGVLAFLAGLGTGCGAATPQELGGPVAADVPALAEVDWRYVTYASACGLDMVAVRGGVGETRTSGDFFGIEVIDAAVGELDGVAGDEAAILVDCLGADSYRPHVLVVRQSGLPGTGSTVVVPETGGSVAAGNRPLGIDIVDPGSADSGSIQVTVDDGGDEVAHRLAFVSAGPAGGELTAVPAGAA